MYLRQKMSLTVIKIQTVFFREGLNKIKVYNIYFNHFFFHLLFHYLSFARYFSLALILSIIYFFFLKYSL